MKKRLQQFISLTRMLQKPMDMDPLLQLVVSCATNLVGTERSSIRMLDTSGTQLLATCRSGESLHLDSNIKFKIGEGLIGWIIEHAKPLRLGNAEQDPRFIHRPGMKDQMGSFLGVPIISGNTCLGVISTVHSENDFFTSEHESLLLLLAGICAPQIEIARLSRLTTVDPLTGALNRRGMDMLLPDLFASLKKDVKTISVAMLDLDYFKRVNDRYGHLVGDQVLRKTAHILSVIVRKSDAIVRYGGEEFLIIFPGVGLCVAKTIAERARCTLETTRIGVGELEIQVTVSIGVAELRKEEGSDELIKRADEALYRAKGAGRNRVEVYQ